MAPPPTIDQQKGMAYAPMPFGALSFLSSSYVIYHLLFQEPQKRERLYHRLIFAMNFALLPPSFTQALSNLPVPEGTPYYIGAMGTVDTCTAQGFVGIMFSMTVPTYYGSLALQALLGIRNNFKEENYRWIEIPVHLIAYCVPCAFATVLAATENINPSGSGCWYSKAPRGCESNPDVPCQRGEDIHYFVYIVGFSQAFLYFIFPPMVVVSMCCWVKKMQKSGSKRGSGMWAMRDEAKKEMMQFVHIQASLYLVSFWFTFIFAVISSVYQLLAAGDMIYNLAIFANCIYSLQGFVMMSVYFILQNMGRKPRVDCLRKNTPSSSRVQLELTVSDIRSNVQRKIENRVEEASNEPAERFSFNIFDGVPDPDSPWARFFDDGNHSDNGHASDEGEHPLQEDATEQAQSN